MSAIVVRFADAEVSCAPALVRSWCRCDECGESATGKRWTSPTEIPADLSAGRVAQAGSILTIEWSDGHRSEIDVRTVHAPAPQERFGGGLPMGSVPTRRYDEVMTSDAGLHGALDDLVGAGVVHVVDGPADPDATVAFAERFGPIRITSYGQVQVFITAADARTAAHTGVAQHPHTDEPFRYCPPGFLFFHSVESAPDGEGTSLLVDGVAAAERLRHDDPASFDWLASEPVEFHRRHDGDVTFSTRSPVLTLDPGTGAVEGIRINHRCLAPLDPSGTDPDRTLRAIQALSRLIEDPAHQHRLHLGAGEFLVFDNHRIMHGRTAFSDRSPRHLRSCNVDRDEVHSRYRVLSEQQGHEPMRLRRGAATR